jgi:hypothetical protein
MLEDSFNQLKKFSLSKSHFPELLTRLDLISLCLDLESIDESQFNTSIRFFA